MTFGKYFERQIEWWWSHVTAMISLELIAILKTVIKIFIYCEFEENCAKGVESHHPSIPQITLQIDAEEDGGSYTSRRRTNEALEF